MRLLPIFLVSIGALGIAAASSPARADWDGDGWRRHEWREHEWREQRWREHERREHEWRERQAYGAPPVIYAPPAYSYAPAALLRRPARRLLRAAAAHLPEPWFLDRLWLSATGRSNAFSMDVA